MYIVYVVYANEVLTNDHKTIVGLFNEKRNAYRAAVKSMCEIYPALYDFYLDEYEQKSFGFNCLYKNKEPLSEPDFVKALKKHVKHKSDWEVLLSKFNTEKYKICIEVIHAH